MTGSMTGSMSNTVALRPAHHGMAIRATPWQLLFVRHARHLISSGRQQVNGQMCQELRGGGRDSAPGGDRNKIRLLT